MVHVTRVTEAAAAIKRRESKKQAKQERDASSRADTARRLRQAHDQSQAKRSAAFAAARARNGVKVRIAVYEDNVAAEGVEMLLPPPGAAAPTPSLAKAETVGDPKETLLHLAVTASDLALVEWLMDHGMPCCSSLLFR